jgi:hypothetical protein
MVTVSKLIPYLSNPTSLKGFTTKQRRVIFYHQVLFFFFFQCHKMSLGGLFIFTSYNPKRKEGRRERKERVRKESEGKEMGENEAGRRKHPWLAVSSLLIYSVRCRQVQDAGLDLQTATETAQVEPFLAFVPRLLHT